MSYIIAGRAIKSEYLALGTLFTTGLLATLASSGGGEKKKQPAPSGVERTVGLAKEQGKIGSSEEEDFIRNFIAEAEKSDKH